MGCVPDARGEISATNGDKAPSYRGARDGPAVISYRFRRPAAIGRVRIPDPGGAVPRGADDLRSRTEVRNNHDVLWPFEDRDRQSLRSVRNGDGTVTVADAAQG